MTSAIPVHSYHPPRHPHAITPTSNPTPRSSVSASCYTSSSSSTQNTSYWPNGQCSSVSTTSSTTSPRINVGLAAAQYVTKHAAGRLHKRSRSGHKTPEEIPDEMFDEGFFSGPGSPPPTEIVFKKAIKSKSKIKPLLKKVSGSSRNNSLDLSRSDGGLPNGVVGLGIYDSQGYDSSGVDEELLETAFPRHPRKRHQRNISGFSLTASANSPLIPGASQTQPFAHPKRQVPRRGVYTPDLSRDGTSNESSEDEDDERETRRIVLSGSNQSTRARTSLTINTNYDGHSTPMLVAHTTTSVTDLGSASNARTLSSPLPPILPVSSSVDSISTALPLKRRGRHLSSTKEPKIREASPSFAASVTAARLAWEAKEEKKEQKRENKRRRSEAKEGERKTSSRTSNRGRGNSGSSSQTAGTVWDADNEEESDKTNDQERDEDEVYTGRDSMNRSREPPVSESASTRGENATGKKWGILSADQGQKQGRKHLGLKKRWLGFIVWVRIGMVRLGRKMGF